MKTLQQLKTQMLANPETRKAYDALADEFGMARELIAARASMGLTPSFAGWCIPPRWCHQRPDLAQFRICLIYLGQLCTICLCRV